MKYSIEKDFVVITPEKTAKIEPFDTKLYETLASNYGSFKGHELISCHSFSENWSSWEIHPNGDEIVILLSGCVRFILETSSENQEVTLENAGDFLIVPQNVWHTAKTDVASKVLFITPGEGTKNRDGA